MSRRGKSASLTRKPSMSGIAVLSKERSASLYCLNKGPLIRYGNVGLPAKHIFGFGHRPKVLRTNSSHAENFILGSNTRELSFFLRLSDPAEHFSPELNNVR